MNFLKQTSFYLIILLSVFVLRCAYYNTLFNAKKEYELGIEILQGEPDKQTHPQADRHFSQTIDKCWKLIDLYTDKSKYADDAFLLIIKSEFNLNKVAQSKSHLNQFLAKYPKSELIPEAYLWAGKISLAEKNKDQGLEYLNRSITATNDSKIRAQAYYELGNYAFENGDFGGAIQSFEKALNEKISKQYAAFIQFYLGEASFQEGEYKEAIKRYRTVAKFSPSLDVEYKTKYNLARSYSAVGNNKEALKILRKMLTAPRFKNFVPFIKSEIANIYHKQGNDIDAIELYKEVILARIPNPGTALASFQLAEIYQNTIHNVDSAVYYFGEVRKLYPRWDSVQVAENNRLFLTQLKEIKDGIKNDSRLVFRLENDHYFRDSLYKAQMEDSLFGQLNKSDMSPLDSALMDSTFIDSLITDSLLNDTLTLDSLISLPDSVRDSILIAFKDTLHVRDSLRQVLRADSLRQRQAAGDFIQRGKTQKNQTSQLGRAGPNNRRKKKEVRKLEKRKLPAIKDDLKKNKYHLAEYFLLEVQNYDSALYHYKRFLKSYDDSVLTSKALYSMYFIYGQSSFRDSVKQDSLANILVTKYPDSPFTKEILKQKGLYQEERKPENSDAAAENLFLKAEKLYDSGQIDSALTLYRKVSEIDTALIWSAKAQLARAWIYEHDLNDTDQAIKEYKSLHDNFSLNEFKLFAEKKIAKPVEKENTPAVQQSSDSLLAVSPSDSSGKAAVLASNVPANQRPEEIDQSSLPSVAKTKRYRQWRQARSNK